MKKSRTQASGLVWEYPDIKVGQLEDWELVVLGLTPEKSEAWGYFLGEESLWGI